MADRKKMEGNCSTGQSPQWAVVPMEGDEDEEQQQQQQQQQDCLLVAGLHQFLKICTG